MMRTVFLVLASVAKADDSIIVLPAPQNTSAAKALLVYVPGGLVPNTYYSPVLQKMQEKLTGKVDLWVSIVSCPSPGLCIPSFATANITAAFDAGRLASGIQDPKEIWFGGHSLGGVAADYHVSKFDNGTAIQGGALVWGDYIFEGPDKLVNYPVPVLSLLGEVNFGSARPFKMAPYFAAANAAGEDTLHRSPVVVIKDIDHSDMCEGFHVEGDLPSATTPEKAVDAIADLSATFMASQILKDKDSKRKMDEHLSFTREYMKPVNEALSLDSHSSKWCETMQNVLAGPYASKITITSQYSDSEWLEPSAELQDDGTVKVVVTGQNVYENANAFAWPPSDPWPFFGALQSNLGVPAVDHNSPLEQGCRLVSRTKIAKLLGGKSNEPKDFCKRANEKAWDWALFHAPPRSVARYESASPCNNCTRGWRVSTGEDSTTDDFETFANSSLVFSPEAEQMNIVSPVFSSDDEHACKLLSPSRALDFLMLDSFLESTYKAPTRFVV